MALVKLVVLPVPQELRDVLDYEARILVASDELLDECASGAARLGAQDVDGFQAESLRSSFSGFVKQMPQEGDELRVALDSDEFIPTGLTYQVPVDGPNV